jgi:hypothetical protein
MLQRDGKLYHKEEEWDTWQIRCEVENAGVGGSGSSCEGSSSGSGCGDHGRDRVCGVGSGSHGPKKTDECHCYGKLGIGARIADPRPKRSRLL